MHVRIPSIYMLASLAKRLVAFSSSIMMHNGEDLRCQWTYVMGLLFACVQK